MAEFSRSIELRIGVPKFNVELSSVWLKNKPKNVSCVQ